MHRACLIFAAAAVLACSTARADMTVYVIDGLARVRPKDSPRATTSISLSAARNEYEPFQVIVHAGAQELTGVRVRASGLKSQDSTIDLSNVALYQERFVYVSQSTPRSKERPNWYPDALVPCSLSTPDDSDHAAGTPFRVEPNSNQPFWVDIHVPRDTPPGVYAATITVTADGVASQSISLELTVWNITLPDTPSMRSNFGKLGTDIADAYNVVMNSDEFRIPEWKYAVALAQHRISPIIPNTLYPVVNRDGTIDPSTTHEGLKRWIETFHVTGFPLRLLGDDPTGADRARNMNHLRAMYAYLKENGWEQMAYVYVLDEPNSAAQYEEVRRRAKLIHDAQPGIPVLCTEQPGPDKPQWGSLVGSVDIWVPLWPKFNGDDIAERLRAGDRAWSYTALTQGRPGRDTPYWEIDFPLLDFRIPAWLSWRYGLTGMLYWSVVNWSRTPDMWTNPATYHVKKDVYNGDGALIYPGIQAGIDGPVVSMRFKQIREGFEDYEYLKMLSERGDSTFVQETLAKIARSWTDWNPDPQALYAARNAILERLASRQQ